ncbi:hypothetical protein XENORESO_017433 [Xenotaenia resolanae]|uniref:UBZ4-type domain-containing protein n=1 Tax=Xenotaenia resolanae TaxID=208358 RepID=A0ABV0WFD3_9TELE
MADLTSTVSDSVQCPVCFKDFTPETINGHLDACLLSGAADSSPSNAAESGPPVKKPRISEPVNDSVSASSSMAGAQSSSALFAVFQNKGKLDVGPDRSVVLNSKRSPVSTLTKGTKRVLAEAGSGSAAMETPSGSNGETEMTSNRLSARTLFSLNKPLAEVLRPNTLEDYFGQNKVVGQKTLIRSLLESQEIPSLILWGPPGCGKTTLAHIIASTSKKKGSARFVTLSATSTSTNEVREVIKQAQNELRLCKRKTILFIDEIHRFNKSQQDTFLPHVECGTVTLIGATTENPSFQVNAALLSRCRVLVLEKLSVEAMGSILNRAVAALGIQVWGQGPTNSSYRDQTNGNE